MPTPGVLESGRIDPLQAGQPPIKFQPLGLAYLGAALQNDGFSVEVLDASAERLTPKEVVAEIRRRRPRLVGLSVICFTLPTVYQILRGLRRVEPEIPVVLGNLQVATDPHVVAKVGADYGVLGWGEETLVALARFLFRGEQELDGIGGLVLVDGNDVSINPPRAPQNFENVAPPDRRLLAGSRYHSPVDHRPIANITTTRGCAFRCDHCHHSSPGVRRVHPYQHRSVSHILDEFAAIRRDTQARFVVFVDDTFTTRGEQIYELCEALANSDQRLPWSCETRASLLDEPILLAMRRAGCQVISIGVETACEQIRADSHKCVTNAEIRDAFELCRQIGMEAKANFMFGLPGEGPSHLEDSIRFAIDLKPEYVEFHFALALPDTPLAEDGISRGIIAPDAYDRFMRGEACFPVYVPEGLSVEQLVSAEKEAYRRFYLRPSYVLDRLRKLRGPGELLRHVSFGLWVVKNSLRTRS